MNVQENQSVLSEYAREARKDPHVAELASMISTRGPMNFAIVAIPLLLTTDVAHFDNTLAQYAKQTIADKTTIVVLANAPVGYMTESEYDEKIDYLFEITENYDLDVRLVYYRQEPGTPIGAIRKLLWDAIAVAYYNNYTETPVSMYPDLKNNIEVLNPRNLLDDKTYDIIRYVFGCNAIVFNHDIDLDFMPRYYMQIAASKSLVDLMFKVSDGAFFIQATHSRSENHPNINSVVAVYDHITSLTGSFEAATAVMLDSYCKQGGFNSDAKTYEVCGLTEKLKPSFIRTSPLRTSPRRMVEKLRHCELKEVWGTATGNPEDGDFGDSDTCRSDWESLPDIDDARKESLITNYISNDDTGARVFVASMVRVSRTDETFRDYYALIKTARLEISREEYGDKCGEIIKNRCKVQLEVLRRILSYTISKESVNEIIDKITLDAEREVDSFIAREVEKYRN